MTIRKNIFEKVKDLQMYVNDTTSIKIPVCDEDLTSEFIKDNHTIQGIEAKIQELNEMKNLLNLLK